MDQLARDFADEAYFLFVYTREAHPEMFPEFPAIRSIDQKFDHARLMRDRHQTPRTILVDDVGGTVHRAYSGCSNMSWIIDHTGRVHFKANWTVAADLRNALEAAVRIRDMKRDPHSEAVQYFTEGTGYNRVPRRSRSDQPSAH